MALDPLATTADLTARGIEFDETRAEEFLDSASAEVRNAAGVPILEATFTVKLPGVCDQWLHLPGQPVTEVTSVEIDGESVDDWKLIGGHLWREDGWQDEWWEPSEVTATITGGLAEVPRDIVDLVCSMVGLALDRASGGGYASRGDQVAARIDDYSEQYDASSGGRKAGPMELPEATRQRLRNRFGGGAALVRSRGGAHAIGSAAWRW
ncbi:MAG: hypothetical protein ACODAF_10080 [Actinomycetota bacterium]